MTASDPEASSTAALIVAAGRSVRAGGEVPKQYRLLAGKPLLRWSAEAFVRHARIGAIHIVVAEGEEARAAALLEGLPISIGVGGGSRQESVKRGLAQLEGAFPQQVLIHDAARPLLSGELIDRVLDGLSQAPGACPALPVVDSLRKGDGFINGEVARDGLWRVQTPQGFDYALISAAHARVADGATDDAEVLRSAGHPVRMVEGDERAMKVTLPQDFETAERLLDWATLTGSGYDVHRFGPGDHVWLCGIQVPHSAGLVGHSDADVGLHALTDAILGALCDGDIGTHFPPTDPKWKGASSDRFLAHAAELVAKAGGRILHCDVTLICEAPKVSPHRPAMLQRLAGILEAHAPRLSVKATTSEGLGFTGRREGIAAQALATIRLPSWN
ncbi:bifunctional 2-C-methyl-D-erythritol 4-phosphate cytidylyltransferase/2-C-methyl-D-erythritol 2,4-cyclodiphosphate synthase [Sandaracinobacter sp. RS1-74]|uniref:bifunctional 2-C-methyl-D-erythritol 4-phosphate cytidylyltransferase/2-C-methyl-D-erythritol 2,4-cyclodiphosphate synthase n=1 Tax=Sandaracinobacteroides sayramensis TaxID=2913411 RepID=UPI001EDC77D1|nr:bifunctional 2-C-methyl-D-erythritol 4-phosphate cytidylyltransferase/2-C-methyl-D-erythritol 2,4-cyclodiphosphate synthase [Sandaracinobacteroides sayramensis]MCG2840044.1 bifunctional 2-C-methyl-D-erythritol 4-phosphate cytidylyltransferase/2-C-methyl-D-erythritol 2,4-cyclodiphosphate synthase [Sandaracinobacteroides sayramensis]